MDGWSAMVRAKQETRDVVAGEAAGGICRWLWAIHDLHPDVHNLSPLICVKVPVDTRVPVLF